jgi:aminomethyltransferase
MSDLATTPLYDLHLELGARMVPFAGYSMPVQYTGIMGEHTQTRENAGLFDVSHMGQVILSGPDYPTIAAAFETLVPANALGLGVNRQRYGFFTNDAGGIEDDLMFANKGDHMFVVVNAACKGADIARMRAALEPQGITVTEVTDRALIALQGPRAEDALATLNPAAAQMRFMDVAEFDLLGVTCWVSRSGYTGEDGYEISVPAESADALARQLLDHAAVAAIGLGARDSLRLEAGLCLYGHDIDATTTPVEAGLVWGMQKSRRAGGDRAGGFPGADVILPQITDGTARKRVGLSPDGRAPMREGVVLFAAAEGGDPIGRITSGGFGPTVGGPVAMGYVPAEMTETGTKIYGELRGKRLPLTVAALPFVAANFKR